ncbi:MAG: MFS transporter, partial [Candidatus Eremiobacteraeota bacterium]|nr:MFS transporter [Candidatus Eremiobacteraeota bacterium]
MAVANPLALARTLTPVQRKTFLAAFLGWTLDAFDFFIVTFVLKDIGEEFGLGATSVVWAITVTLLCRPIGALIFGTLADRFGRRGPLMASILLYSVFELASGFAPSFAVLVVLRALYGVAMGGEWGVGAALSLESMPAEARGFFSGVLQQGYATGFLLAAIVFYLVEPHYGWRAMFFVGAAP